MKHDNNHGIKILVPLKQMFFVSSGSDVHLHVFAAAVASSSSSHSSSTASDMI